MNKTVINTSKSHNSNIPNIKAQQLIQIMVNITDRILKFKPMAIKPIMTNYTYFIVIIFNRVNSFTLINSVLI